MRRLLLLGACLLSSCSKPERVTPLAQGELDQIVVEPFRQLYPGYVAHYQPTEVPRSPRRHFAGDPKLTPLQARLRWVFPVMYPSYVDDKSVFVKTSTGWHSLDGLDTAMLDRLRALDAKCAGYVEAVTATSPCLPLAWQIADAGLRGDAARFSHACQLATTQCAQ